MNAFPRSCAFLLTLNAAWAVPAEPHWFNQTIDHFSTSTASFQQRFYMSDTHFKGPGSLIIVIMGGEGGISPSTGIFYPWVLEVLAKMFGALVLEPEHRFYGASLPFGDDSFTREHLEVMNTQQALADAATFIRAQQAARGCTARGTAGYCPVLTVGGSYPGFLSAMMRLRYPAVVDMAYAASAPMKFYSQEVDQYAYYDVITASAERSLPGCAKAVKLSFEATLSFFQNATADETSKRFRLCPHGIDRDAVADDLFFLAEQTFANLNMANYPPDDSTDLHQACLRFSAAAQQGETSMIDAVRSLLINGNGLQAGRAALRSMRSKPESNDGCLDLGSQLPAGSAATARCGDWSGCGVGRDGEMWDYQTCTFEVEAIGFGTSKQMFPDRPWSAQWLTDHCARRFGVTPQPRALADLWGFDEAGLKAASRIIFTNGLNDGWSAGAILHDIVPESVVSINLPNGAHHSDLYHQYPVKGETPDVIAAHSKILELVGTWLHGIQEEVQHISI